MNRCKNPRELAVALGLVQVTPQGVEYEMAVAEGARKWVAEFGKRPTNGSGDATGYVGFPTTWGGVSDSFRFGYNGVRKTGGLRAFLDEKEIGAPFRSPLRGKEYEQAAAQAARAHVAIHGYRPSHASGKVVLRGWSTSWSSVSQAFANGAHGVRLLGGLPAFLDEQGIGERATVTVFGEAYETAVARGARKYVKENGRRPTANGSYATPYVGFKTTWRAINDSFRTGCNGARVLGGLPAFLDEQKIGQRARGNFEAVDLLDLEDRLLSGVTMMAFAESVGLHVQTVLCAFKKKHGMTPREWLAKPEQTERQLRLAVRAYFDEHKRVPGRGDLRGRCWTQVDVDFCAVRDEELGLNKPVRRLAAERAYSARRVKSAPNSFAWWLAEKNVLASDVMRKIGLSQATLCRYANGQRTPSADNAVRIAKALGLKPEQIKWDAK